MSSLTKAAPKATNVVINGKPYALPALALRELKKIQGWLDTQTSPLEKFATYSAGLSPEKRSEEEASLSLAMRHWPPKIGSQEAAEFLATMDGLEFVIKLLLRKGQPDLNDNAIQDLADDIDPSCLDQVLGMALGIEATEDKADPKA